MKKLFRTQSVRSFLGSAAVVALAVSTPQPSAAQTAASSSAGGKVEASSSGESSGRAKISLTPLIVQEGERLIENKIICAGQPSESRVKTLAGQGIPILDLRTPKQIKGASFDEAAVVAAASGSYTALGIDAKSLGDTALQKKLFDAIDEIRGRAGASYVHAKTGDLVGAAIALHAAKRGGKSLAEAVKLGKAALMGESEARVKELIGSK